MTDLKFKPLVLYDIPSTLPQKAWTPNPWKARFALNIKRLPYRTVWVEYPDIARCCTQLGAPPTRTTADGAPMYTLPVLADPNTGVVTAESFAIARYLDAAYPATPRLVPRGAGALQAAFNDAFMEKVPSYPPHRAAPLTRWEKVMMPHLWPTLALKTLDILSPPSASYFRRAREAELSVRMEDIAPPGAPRAACWARALAGFSAVRGWIIEGGEGGEFVGGDAPVFADLVLVAHVLLVKGVHGAQSAEWEEVMRADAGWWKQLVEAFEGWMQVDAGTDFV